MLNEREDGGVALGALIGARSATASAIRAATEAKPAGGVYAYVTMRAALAEQICNSF